MNYENGGERANKRVGEEERDTEGQSENERVFERKRWCPCVR